LDVPQARRAGRPQWVNARTLLGLVLFAAAFLGGRQVLREGDTTVPIWVASRDLSSGAELGVENLEIARVDLPGGLLDSYVGASVSLDGARLTRPVSEGELIPAAWTAHLAPGSTPNALTVPVTPEHAVGGDLAPGDRIDVYASFDVGDVRARTMVVARGVEVLDVITAGGLVVGEEAVVGITVAVDATDVGRLAFAIRNGEIDVVRVEGADHGNPGDTTIGFEELGE
jgi:Flp pilus assembly protein CpaB